MWCNIVVATHKQYWMPSDPIYLPLHVGAVGKENLGYQRDDEGDNISEKNANYCELTGLYWAWKNLEADYIGLVHYRRHFSNGNLFLRKEQRIISEGELEKQLKTCDVLLPRPRNYYIETNYGQYAHAHHAIDLDLTKQILQEKYPDYITAWEISMRKTAGHRFNMFVMKKGKLNAYCEWLFDVLFELESRLNISTYNKNDSRVFGFVGERLLDIWLDTNQIRYKDIPYVFMEKQNWIVKGGSFIKRKFQHIGLTEQNDTGKYNI